MRGNRKGQALIAAIFVLVVIGVLGTVAASLLSSESFSVTKNYHGLQALNVADAGINFTIVASLAADGDWSNNADFGPVALNPGAFSVHYAGKQTTSCTIEVTGTVNGVSRTVTVAITKPGSLPEAFNYALYWRNLAGTTSRFEIGSALINPTYITGECFLNGNGSVYTGSTVASGEIYVPTGYNVNGSGTYSWEVTTSSPPWPALDNSYYVNLINKYNSHIPATPAPAYPSPNWPYTITLNGNIVSFESIPVNWPFGRLTIRGSGEVISRGDITINGGLLIQPSAGNTIALVANNTMTIGPRVGTSGSLEAGTHLYSRNGELLFNKFLPFGTIFASRILMMSGVRVTLNWYASHLGGDSIVYVPTNAIGLQKFLEAAPYVVDLSFTSTDIFYGSLIVDCTDPSRWVRFLDGQMYGIIYSPVCPIRLYGTNVIINGALVADKVYSFYADRMLDANINWAPSFLPSVAPPGLGTNKFVLTKWREVY